VEMEDVSDAENIAVEDESDKKKDIKVDDAKINEVVSTTDAKNTWEVIYSYLL
jgi:AAA+ superfamily predicted ATPase